MSLPQSPPLQLQHPDTHAGTIAAAFTRTFLSEIPASVQREAWRVAPNELRRLLALAPRTMLFAHRALSSLCHPHLSTVAWRCDLATGLTAAQAAEDLLPWKLHAADRQQQQMAQLAKSRRSVSRDAQAAAYHGSVVPAEPSRAAPGTRRFHALTQALNGDALLHDEANQLDIAAASAPPPPSVNDALFATASGTTLVVSNSATEAAAGDDENDEEEDAADCDEEGEELSDADGAERRRRRRRRGQRRRVSLQDKWMLLAEIHAQVRMSDAAVQVPTPTTPLPPLAGNSDAPQPPALRKTTARQVSANCIAEWRRSPLVLSMLRIVFQRLATAPSETALRNSGVSGGVAALKRALSVRFGAEDSVINGNGNGDSLTNAVSLHVNAAVLPSDFALLSNPDRQRDGTLSREMSRIFSGGGPASEQQQQKAGGDPLVDSYISVASYVLFQQRLFSVLYHATADEQVMCAALLDFIADADYVGGGSLSRMTNDVGRSATAHGAGGVDPVVAAQSMRRSMHSFGRLSSVRLDKIRFDGAATAVSAESSLVGGGAGMLADPTGGGAGSALSAQARSQLLLDSVPKMKGAMRAKVLAAAKALSASAALFAPAAEDGDGDAAHANDDEDGDDDAEYAGSVPALLGAAVAAATEQRRQKQQQHPQGDGGVFALTQAEFEDALDATFDTTTAGNGAGGGPAAGAGDAAVDAVSRRRRQHAKTQRARDAIAGVSSSSSANLLHVRDFSKFGVFYEKFAKFMFELCDNWAASHTVDGVAAFLGFVARAAFPAPIDTVWQRNLPLMLKNEQRERQKKEQAARDAADAAAAAASSSLDAQLDLVEALAAEEAALEAGTSDVSGKRGSKRKSEKEKMEALQMTVAAFKAGKNGKVPKKGGTPSSGAAVGGSGAGAGAAGAKSERKGRPSFDANVPEIVVHAPGVKEAEDAAAAAAAASTRKKGKRQVRFRFDNDDYGSDEDADAAGDADVGDGDDKKRRDSVKSDGDGDTRVDVAAEVNTADGANSGDAAAAAAAAAAGSGSARPAPTVGADDPASSSNDAGGGGGDDDPRRQLAEHRRQKREAAAAAEEAERTRRQESGGDAAATDGTSDPANAKNDGDLPRQKDDGEGDLLPIADDNGHSESQNVNDAEKPSGSDPDLEHAAASTDATVPVPQQASVRVPPPRMQPTPPASRGGKKASLPPPLRDGETKKCDIDEGTAVDGATQPSVSSSARRPQPRDRFLERRSWFRGDHQSTVAADAEMRDWPLQVEQPAPQRKQYANVERFHRDHAPGAPTSRPSTATVALGARAAAATAAASVAPPATIMTAGTQTMTVWWKPDDRECVKVRLVRPFEERRLVLLGQPVPPAKRK